MTRQPSKQLPRTITKFTKDLIKSWLKPGVTGSLAGL